MGNPWASSSSPRRAAAASASRAVYACAEALADSLIQGLIASEPLDCHLSVRRNLGLLLCRCRSKRQSLPLYSHLRTAFSVAYGVGLRISKINCLSVADIDSQRMTLRVEQGKDRKDCYAMSPPLLLERLRAWWKALMHRAGSAQTAGLFLAPTQWFP